MAKGRRGLGRAHLGGKRMGFLHPSVSKPKARLGTPLGHQVSPGWPAVTFSL